MFSMPKLPKRRRLVERKDEPGAEDSDSPGKHDRDEQGASEEPEGVPQPRGGARGRQAAAAAELGKGRAGKAAAGVKRPKSAPASRPGGDDVGAPARHASRHAGGDVGAPAPHEDSEDDGDEAHLPLESRLAREVSGWAATYGFIRHDKVYVVAYSW